MGYYETVCQLCGVSFAIARLRRADEPEEAAWGYYGSDFVDVEHETDGVCGEGSGCTVSEGNRAGEHIAGPRCVSKQGYTGHRVSLAEMKGCRAVQCLVKKDADWRPEDDDQDFELKGDFYLTGIGDGSPDVAPLEDIEPVRHGISSIDIANTEAVPDWGQGLPFHPTCFEIYKRVCRMRNGRVDLEGLYYWRHLDCDYETFFVDFPRDPAVRSGNDQWWWHESGCEYLVANPIDIPGLSQLLEPPVYDAGQKTTFDVTKSPDDSQTEVHRASPSTSNAVKDPFSPLSADITSIILDYLGSKDIANLRLATPVFRQLPTILFRRLLLEDMPWLYEVKELDVAEIDWYDFYCILKSSWKDLKGLRNRRRIWRDVEEILGRIEEYRKKGEISA